ncbi:MAG: thioredoxin family protein [Gudongella sp.]|jgi:small redox-active disulfide protein 2|nr:thioredoxin family protein [Gudongella sp.]
MVKIFRKATDRMQQNKDEFSENNNSKSIMQSEVTHNGDFIVKILGSGCSKCNQLEAATREALSELGMDNPIEHVTDFKQIAAYGIMTTPALVVNEKVVSYGKVLKKNEVISILGRLRR